MTFKDCLELLFYISLFGLHTVFLAPKIVRALDSYRES